MTRPWSRIIQSYQNTGHEVPEEDWFIIGDVEGLNNFVGTIYTHNNIRDNKINDNHNYNNKYNNSRCHAML